LVNPYPACFNNYEQLLWGNGVLSAAKPYSNETMIDLVARIKSLVPKYVRISRVLREIPVKFITEGVKDALRGILKERMIQLELECRCIRCREYSHRARAGWKIGEPHLERMEYEASGGREILLSFEDRNETLYGLLRLRIQPQAINSLGEGSDIALIRELHVFGQEVSLSQRDSGAAQHKGLGKALMREAERIAREEFGRKKIAVLSGIGAREYYRAEFGYELQGAYMVREL